MSEPVAGGLVDALCGIIEESIGCAVGDYLSHDQANRLRDVIGRHECLHYPNAPNLHHFGFTDGFGNTLSPNQGKS